MENTVSTNPKLSLQEILDESIWVAKYTNRYRQTGRYADLEGDDNIRDLDLIVLEGQPAKLQPFFKDYYDYEDKHGWITIPDYYNQVWVNKL